MLRESCSRLGLAFLGLASRAHGLRLQRQRTPVRRRQRCVPRCEQTVAGDWLRVWLRVRLKIRRAFAERIRCAFAGRRDRETLLDDLRHFLAGGDQLEDAPVNLPIAELLGPEGVMT
jgi:hypothetical protein